MSFGPRGVEAVRNKQWAAAIPQLDKALETSNSPTWLLARSQAHQMLKNYDDALADAEAAYHAAVARGSGSSRKLMIDAQYRRACILFALGRHADADCCCKWSMLLAEGHPASEADGVEKKVDADGRYTITLQEAIADNEGQPGKKSPDEQTRSDDSSAASGGSASAAMNIVNATAGSGDSYATVWNRAYVYRAQIVGSLERLPADHPGRKVTVTKVPPVRQKQKLAKEAPAIAAAAPLAVTQEKKLPVGPVPIEKLKLRADFYQSGQNVTVSLFAKDVKKDDLSVKFEKNRVVVGPIPREADPSVQSDDPKSFSTFILAGDINPAASKFSVSPRKIELILQKHTPGSKWPSWGKEEIGRPESTDDEESTDIPATAVSEARPADDENVKPQEQPAPGAPAYPTSSKTGPKNWETLAAGEAEDESSQDVNYFFQKLFAGSSRDQQRAMMKSFTESGGTSLINDWNQVKDHKVEIMPPEGTEVKKW